MKPRPVPCGSRGWGAAVHVMRVSTGSRSRLGDEVLEELLDSAGVYTASSEARASPTFVNRYGVPRGMKTQETAGA